MGTISIHGVSPEMETALKNKAKENHQSLSSFIKKILENSIGKKNKINKNREYFKKFAGTWTEQECLEFDSATSDFEQIHPEDWK